MATSRPDAKAPERPDWGARLAQVVADTVRRNFYLKVVALALAVVAWLLVQGRPTSEDYATIGMEYVWPDHLVLEGEPVDQVLVKVRGRRAALRELSKRDPRYHVDLSTAATGETTLNLSGIPVTDFPPELEITTISPSSLTFIFDERIARALPVKVPTRGDVSFGFQIDEIVADPDVVTLSGARPELEALEEIKTRPLDVTGRDRDFAEILVLDLPSERVRPDHDAEVSVFVRMSQIIEERQVDVPVIVPQSMTGVTVEPAQARVVLHGPARELHLVRVSSVQLVVHEGTLAFREGTARVPYDADGAVTDTASIRISSEGLPASVKVLSVKPATFTLTRR